MKTAATLREIPCDQHVTRHRMVQIAYNNQGAASLTVPGKTLKHIDRFLRRRCALDLLPLYPNSKEISESEACRYAAVKKLGFDPNDERTTAVVVGDGKGARTGSLLAYTTKWRVWSIDPLVTPGHRPVERLTLIPEKVQNVPLLYEQEGDQSWTPRKAVLIAPHSHADLAIAAELMERSWPEAPLAAMALPCCRDQRLPGRTCAVRYDDLACWSARSSVQLWPDASAAGGGRPAGESPEDPAAEDAESGD